MNTYIITTLVTSFKPSLEHTVETVVRANKIQIVTPYVIIYNDDVWATYPSPIPTIKVDQLFPDGSTTNIYTNSRIVY